MPGARPPDELELLLLRAQGAPEPPCGREPLGWRRLAVTAGDAERLFLIDVLLRLVIELLYGVSGYQTVEPWASGTPLVCVYLGARGCS